MAIGRRLRDALILLPLAGAVALLPPVVLLFNAPVDVLGIPLKVFYVFTVWLALVVAAALLGRRVGRFDD